MWPKFDACGPPLPCDQNLIWCLWSRLTRWPKFHACGPPLPCDQNSIPVVPPLPFYQKLIPVVPPYHVTKIWSLWSPLTIWPKFDACGTPLPCDQNLMPVVPPYHFTKNWSLWSPLTMWPKFDACGPTLPCDQNFMSRMWLAWCLSPANQVAFFTVRANKFAYLDNILAL